MRKIKCRPNIKTLIDNSPPEWWQHSVKTWFQLSDFISAIDLSLTPFISDQSHWCAVQGGIGNFNYKLSIAQHQLFVQVVDNENIKRLPDQRFVSTNLLISNNTQLQPWLIPCLHETQQLRIFKWIDASNTSSEIFNTKLLEQSLFEFLSVLHSSISILPILNINQHLEHYYQLALLSQPSEKLKFELLYERAKICAKSFDASKNCHNDLSPGNILLSQVEDRQQLVVIDWEYACISDPWFDLAGVCINFDLNQSQQKKLILNYSENLGLYPKWDKFNKMKELYQIINTFWLA